MSTSIIFSGIEQSTYEAYQKAVEKGEATGKLWFVRHKDVDPDTGAITYGKEEIYLGTRRYSDNGESKLTITGDDLSEE